VVLLETRRGVGLFVQALRKRPPQEPAVVAVREAALESIRLVDQPPPPDESYGLAQERQLYNQIAAGKSALIARMIGERVLLIEPLVELVALRMSVDPNIDVRPRLLVHAANAAITVAWLTAAANPEIDRCSLLKDAFDILENGPWHRTGPIRLGAPAGRPLKVMSSEADETTRSATPPEADHRARRATTPLRSVSTTRKGTHGG
jgi:hypothetical protein